MRIGLLTTSFPRFEGDVAGSFVLGFARALAARGHSLEVLAPEPRERVPLPGWPGVDVHWVPYVRPRAAARTFYAAGAPDNMARDPWALAGAAPFAASLLAATLVRRARWDALVSHFALPCGFVAARARQHRPHLCVTHSADLHLLSRLPLRSACATQIARGSTRIAFVSDAQRQRFLGCLPQAARATVQARCEVQAMGIDAPEAPLTAAARARLRSELGLQRFTLLTLARLVPVKGLAEAVCALAERDDLEWLICGDGPERARLQTLARGMRLRVRLLGTVTGADKHALLCAADAFVLPSRVLPSGRSEGVPTALLEAMAHELPVIASDVGGVRELVQPEQTGLLFHPGAPHALEHATDRLRAEPALRAALRAGGLARAQRQHWSALAPRFERMLLAAS